MKVFDSVAEAVGDSARVVAGGPEPDGTAANIFYRVGGIDEDCAQLLHLFEKAVHQIVH